VAAPALAAAALLAVFALSDVVTVGGTPVTTLSVYGTVPWLTSMFRSPGRFVLSLHYLAVLGAVAAAATAWADRPRVLAAMLGAAVLVQAIEVRPPEPFRPAREAAPIDEAWALARGRYRHVALVPPFLFTGGRDFVGEPVWSLDLEAKVAHAAYWIDATFNSAYVSRIDRKRALAAYFGQMAAVIRGELDPETVYVVFSPLVGSFLRAGATCGTMGGFPVCVRDGGGPFAQALRRVP
jgi:hypothetical protein